MEPMITGSPITPESLNYSALYGNSTQSFLPSYLLGSQQDSSAQSPSAFRSQNSGVKQNFRVTWSPELNRTTYYEIHGQNSPESSFSSTAGVQGHGSARVNGSLMVNGLPPVRTLLNVTEDLDQSTSVEKSEWLSNNNFSTLGQIDNSKENRGFDECCVTVFGFGSDEIDFILHQFAQCGTIVKHEFPNKCNWVHLKFQSRIQAAKAIEKNGRIFNSCIMVGVIPCVDQAPLSRFNKCSGSNENPKNIMDGSSLQFSFHDQQSSANGLNTTTDGVLTPNHQNTTQKHNMRLLTSNNTNNNTVRNEANGGIIAKAKHYILGW